MQVQFPMPIGFKKYFISLLNIQFETKIFDYKNHLVYNSVKQMLENFCGYNDNFHDSGIFHKDHIIDNEALTPLQVFVMHIIIFYESQKKDLINTLQLQEYFCFCEIQRLWDLYMLNYDYVNSLILIQQSEDVLFEATYALENQKNLTDELLQ